MRFEEPRFQPADADFADRVLGSFARQGLMQTLGAHLEDVRPGFCEIRLPYRDGLSQQHGFFHAGATAAIADSAGGYAAFSLMGADDSVLSVEYKINLLSPARGDLLIARGRVVRAGKTLSVCHTDVFVRREGNETLCATMQQTVMRLRDRADLPTPG
ncbi:MAG TPA: PaaI family thioesterase [Thermoanaerobaculia bacterium]|nr:PaaI family thioesterase [Thermoanaerobaculia bacterium]